MLSGPVYRLDPKLAPRESTPADDAQAGHEIFSSFGCAACHTLATAAATGSVGPNLDETRPSLELAIARITDGKNGIPAYGDRLSTDQIQAVATFIVESTGAR